MSRLLLVDDNPSVHRIITSLLAPMGVEVVALTAGAEALRLLDQGARFDLVLVDAVMPDMDGWDLLARLRTRADTATMPVLFLAGVLDDVDEDRLAAAPIQGFLRKPTELRDLPSKVATLLVASPTAAPAMSQVALDDLVELDLDTLQATGAAPAADRGEDRRADAASEAFLRAVRADPRRMDALARAVAARLHEPALRDLVRDLVLDLNLPQP